MTTSTEAPFERTHPLGDISALSGNVTQDPQVSISFSDHLGLVHLFAAKGKEQTLCRKLAIKAGPGVASVKKDFTALPLCEGQWMLVAHNVNGFAFAADIEKRVGKLGHVSQQSESRMRFSVSGEKARDVMARGCRLDLHQDVAAEDYCAQTTMAQIGVVLHVRDNAPTYDLYVSAGFARSFWHWLSHTANQFSWAIEQ